MDVQSVLREIAYKSCTIEINDTKVEEKEETVYSIKNPGKQVYIRVLKI